MVAPLRITGTFRFNKLGEELFAAIPAWRVLGPDGLFVAVATLQYDGTTLVIDRPDTTQDATAQNVCAAHNPTTPSPSEELFAADQTAVDAFRLGWVLGQARLGNVGPNAIQREMDVIEAASITTVAQAAVHIKTLAEAVEDLARQLRVLKRTTAIPADVPDRLGG